MSPLSPFALLVNLLLLCQPVASASTHFCDAVVGMLLCVRADILAGPVSLEWHACPSLS